MLKQADKAVLMVAMAAIGLRIQVRSLLQQSREVLGPGVLIWAVQIVTCAGLCMLLWCAQLSFLELPGSASSTTQPAHCPSPRCPHEHDVDTYSHLSFAYEADLL